MKTFRYASGRVYGETITVGELKKKLDEYQDDMPMVGSYEAAYGKTTCMLTLDNFSVERPGFAKDVCDCLVITAN